ncbi:MAG TPA: YbaB/EbfC family nucleoid-associated protein [Acidobacteriaceae bacterium]
MNPAKMQEMMAAAQQMQEQMQDKLGQLVVEGSSGGGAVTVRMNGQKQLLKVHLDPSAVAGLAASAEDREMLEDLIVAACNDAGRRADEAAQSGVSGMLSGLGLPPGLF